MLRGLQSLIYKKISDHGWVPLSELLKRVLYYRRLKNNPHELINSHHHIPHLCLGDHTVTVQVVHTEGPHQLLVQRPVQERGQGHQHVLQQQNTWLGTQNLNLTRKLIEPVDSISNALKTW